MNLPVDPADRIADADEEFADPHGWGDYATATSWRAIPCDQAEVAWISLRSWVAELIARFPFLDHHVIPPCWWRHNGHVEALAALRDHERASLSSVAPATGPVEWMRALRDIASLLRSWTADLACGTVHSDQVTPPPIAEDGWAEFLAADVLAREARN